MNGGRLFFFHFSDRHILKYLNRSMLLLPVACLLLCVQPYPTECARPCKLCFHEILTQTAVAVIGSDATDASSGSSLLDLPH